MEMTVNLCITAEAPNKRGNKEERYMADSQTEKRG